MQLGEKEKARTKHVLCEIVFIRKNRVFQEICMRIVVRNTVEDGCGCRESVVRTSRGHRACRKVEIQEAHGSSRKKKESVSLSLFMEVNQLEVDEELSTMATLAWANGSGWENGEKNSRRHGGNRSLKCRHGGK